MEKKYQYIDAHLHLLDDNLSQHRAEVIRLATAKGVEKMICNTTREDQWRQVLELSQQYPHVKPYMGVHPWFADTVESGWLQRLEAFLHDGGGIGEVGLDRLTRVNPSVQEKVFVNQIDLAVRLARPVTIHCIRAWGRLLEILDEYKTANCRFLFHSFGGSQEIMTRLLDMGGFFSFSAALADPTREKLRQVFLKVPLDHLLLETDAPDQYVPQLFKQEAMQKKQPTNEPQYIPQIYAFAAQIRKIDLHQLTTTLWKNGQIFTH